MLNQRQLQLNTSPSHYAHRMSPAPLSPMSKMGSQHRTTSQDSTSDGIRKRVCKACDRCRLKKSKCDGSSPCSRCKADNAICVFGERKKSHDKVYPKGYVEMLEQQQAQLVSGIQEMYRRLVKSGAWESSPLSETNGAPLTHDLLAALGLLESREDGSDEPFEEDCSKLQSRLLADGAGFVHRRGSFDSDSDHSHHAPARTASHGTPIESKPTLFKENFNFPSATSSPLTRSPIPRPRQSNPPIAQWQPTRAPQMVPEYTNQNDPKLFQPEWEPALAQMHDPSQIMRSEYAMQAPQLAEYPATMNDQWNQTSPQYDGSFNPLASCGPNAFSNQVPDLSDLMELDFSKFIHGDLREGIMT